MKKRILAWCLIGTLSIGNLPVYAEEQAEAPVETVQTEQEFMESDTDTEETVEQRDESIEDSSMQQEQLGEELTEAEETAETEKSEVVIETEGVNTNERTVTEEEVISELKELINIYVGHYWTEDGQPSDASGTTSKWHGDIQSKGFANFIYNELFGIWNIGDIAENGYTILNPDGTKELGRVDYVEANNTEDFIHLFETARPGDFVQAKYRNEEKGHSFIVLNVGENDIEVLECNINNDCGIQKRILSWERFTEENVSACVYRALNYIVGQKDGIEVQIEETISENIINEASATVVDSGTCGEHLTWVLDDTGTLTISGYGSMTDYDYLFMIH